MAILTGFKQSDVSAEYGAAISGRPEPSFVLRLDWGL